MASDEHCSKPLYYFFSEEIFNLQYAQNVRLKSRIAHLYANKMRFCVGCFACAQCAAGLRLSACADTPALFASAIAQGQYAAGLRLFRPPRRAQCAFAACLSAGLAAKVFGLRLQTDAQAFISACPKISTPIENHGFARFGRLRFGAQKKHFGAVGGCERRLAGRIRRGISAKRTFA